MEEEIKNTEEKQENNSTRQSWNIFKYDYPIGRLRFILNIFIIMIIAFILTVLSTVISLKFDENEYLPYVISVFVLFFLFMIYLGANNIAKRLYDLFGDKQKALFYTIALYIINATCSFIPIINYIATVLTVIVLLILIVTPGKSSK